MENTTLFTYLFPTQPSPLQSSVSNVAANGFLNVVVSAQGQSLWTSEIDIYIPIGVGAGFLSSNLPLATVNNTGWTISTAQLADISMLPIGLAEFGVTYMVFTCFPQSAAVQLNYDLQFSFQITGVDSVPGPYNVLITEYTSPVQAGPFNPGFGQFTLTKAAATFYLDNLTVSANAGNVNVPFGGVARNTAFVLSWESNGNTFSIFTAQGSTPIYTGINTQFQVSGITSDTTYILQAQIVGGPNSGGTAPGFETISLYDSITVFCTNPDLQSNSITNATTITSVGNITTQANLNVTQKATAGSLQVSGASNLAATTVSAALQVSGVTTLNGPLTAQSATVQVLAAPNVIASGSSTYQKTFTVPTDGSVVGYCPNPSSYNGVCIYWLFVVVAPVAAPSTTYQVGCVGGNTQEGQSISCPATITLPVRKGDVVTVYSTAWNLNKLSTTTVFYFFGQGGPTNLASYYLADTQAVKTNGGPVS